MTWQSLLAISPSASLSLSSSATRSFTLAPAAAGCYRITYNVTGEPDTPQPCRSDTVCTPLLHEPMQWTGRWRISPLPTLPLPALPFPSGPSSGLFASPSSSALFVLVSSQPPPAPSLASARFSDSGAQVRLTIGKLTRQTTTAGCGPTWTLFPLILSEARL